MIPSSCVSAIDAFAKKVILRDQAELFPPFAVRSCRKHSHSKGLFNVVVGALAHGIDRGFDGAMTCHDGNFGSRGRMSLIFRSRSEPERLGNFRSVTTMSGGAISQRIRPPLQRFRPRHRQNRALGRRSCKGAGCFVRHLQSRIAAANRLS